MLEKKLAHCDKQDLPLQINNTATNYPKDKTIVELFEEVVRTTPEVIAIEFESRQLTYKELNEKANQLASYLRKQGIKEETLVGVCLERSLEMIIAVLAIIKAGAGYLPLETAYPEKRLEYLIKDAKAEVILTQKRLRDKIEAISNNTICLDQDWEEIEKESTSNFSVLVRPENMAYVIYTSGSTGNPKGVIVCHQSIVRLIKETNYIKIQSQDVFLQFTPISFDVSTFEIWGSLLNGAKLVVFPAYKPSLNDLGRKIKEYKITVLWLISAIFHQMVEEQIDCFRGLKYLFSGGDVLGVKQVKKLLEQVPGITLINGYGPTENTTFTSCYVMTDVSQVGRTVSIGCPVSNTEIYIVDEDFNIVPIGVMGELYTSGDGLARGYLAKADLTAERFLPNPFSSKPGARLYKVGDLASYLPDGNIEFFGRKDNQVKVRGYRIELGEIETVLDTHPVVKQSVVLVGETPLGDKQLIAYLGVKENVGFIVNEIKEFLGKQLPEHMVPSRFIKIDEFPLTANEKVDRKALLALSQELSEARDYDPPATEEEKILANIWETVLAVRNVSRSDNFFELGGHSLLATRVVSRIREHFQVELSLSTFFSSETLAQLAKKLDLSKSKSLSVVEKITPIPRHQPLPLSFSQKRVWFIQQLASNPLAYTFHSKLELKGNLNINILEKCFNEIINRHEIFRTTFSIVGEEPVQIIHPHHFNSVPVINLSEIPEAEKTLKLEKLINDQISKEFDISELYLIRWLIIRLSHREHVLIHSEHHIVHDGWSFNVFLKELVTLYQAYYLGQNPKLEELKIQFVDFAAWQHQWLETQAAKAQSAYWKNNLTGCPPLLTLPYDRVRPSLQTFQGSSFRQHLSEELCQSLRNLSREKETTLFMVMSAAFTILLYRYSGQKDIALGSTIANRRLQEVENIIGMFVNNIVLRSILSEEERFDDLLEKIKHTTLAAYENQDIPFDRVVDAVNPARSLSYSPICQVFFSFHDAQIPKLEFPEVDINLTEALSNGSSKFDLTAIVIPHFEQSIGANSSSNVKQISLVWEYNSDLFDQNTILRMSKHYQTLLEKILVDRKTPISQISFLDKSEYNQIVGFNSWQKGYCVEKFLPELLQEQALQTPNNIAVILEGKSLTYQQLNERANQLANYLKVKIERQAIVGIYMQSCLEIVVAMIASLKSGIAYVPLSLYYPIDRLNFIINDLNLQLLITHSELKEQVSELKVAKLYLDKENSIFNTSAKHNPKINISGQEIAYIIHTSGSTGLPKGVMITQEAITNHMVWMKDRFSITSEDTTLQRTSISFDASVWEFYLPLIVGARLVLTKPDLNADIKYLLETISSYNITTVQFVPSLLSLIVEEKEFTDSKLKRVFCGGEALSLQLRELFFKSSKAELYNLYGPTETTIDATYYQCVNDAKKQPVLIGKPIDGLQTYILDKHLNIVPIGVVGELFIGGVALARGYYNRPDFTAERFIPNPFGDKLGERLYSTGDLARYLTDGNIEFLGRIDSQVKIRGFRIELGEIESALLEIPTIKDAVVLAKENSKGDKGLVAYLVTKSIEMTLQEVQQILRVKLPSYMIPTGYVFLPFFPLMPNGKIDRNALSTPDIEVSEGFVAPRNTIEEKVVKIWSEILKREKIGVYDNFFALGGHSLLALQIIFRIQKNFNIKMTIRDIFDSATVASLAEKVMLYSGSANEFSSIVVDRTKSLPLSFAQQRLWFLAEFEPDSPVYNTSTTRLITGTINITALEKSVNEIIKRHKSLRTRFSTLLEQPVQIIEDDFYIALETIDLTHLSEVESKQKSVELITQVASKAFDLSKLPLIRVMLFLLSKESAILLLSTHHIVSDAWSINIFLQELCSFYQGFISGQPPSFDPLPIQYVDYALWQRDRLSGEVLEKEFKYWEKKLSGIKPLHSLPIDKPRPTNQTHHGRRQQTIVSKELSQKVVSLSKKASTTLFMTMLASFKLLLYRYSGELDIIVGSPIAGRNHPETEGLIGFFLNTLILRTSFSANDSFLELLEKVRETCLEAYTHQEIPFEKLVELLQPERSLSYSPIFQIMFLLQEDNLSTFNLNDLELSYFDIETNIEKFDLTCSMTQTSNGLEVSLTYNTSLFEDDTITRMLENYQVLLESLINNPSHKVSTLPILNDKEQSILLEGFNQTDVNYPKDVFVYQLFEKQVALTPESIAVSFENKVLTYQELNEKANQLANYLKAQIERQSVVGIYMQNCLEIVVAMIASLKVGVAYVPLSLYYPIDRLNFIINDLNLQLLITHSELKEQTSELKVAKLYLDKEDSIFNTSAKHNPKLNISGQEIAYIIHTSGSTGLPKGVMITQEAIANHMIWMKDRFSITSEDTTLQRTPISFDASVCEFYLPLIVGAKLVITKPDFNSDIKYLLETISSNNITTVQFVPSLLSLIVEEKEFANNKLKRIFCGGEALSPQLKELFFKSSKAELYNVYGPTETTIDATYYQCISEAKKQRVPIGKPIANTKAYILDKNYKIVPIGVIGELYIGGISLARGYYNRPDFTAERFIPNPFSNKLGERLYSTGDQARYLADGNIEFLGRIDNQVKVRGFRIELGEIETVLNSYNAIKQAAVVVKGDATGSKYLVAYSIVSDINNPPSEIELVTFLTSKLPSYMLPNVFVFLEEFPKNSNEKIDREALTRFIDTKNVSEVFVEPQGDIEKTISSIWGDILNLPKVGRLDSFFNLGGHSLSATKIISRLRTQSGVNVMLRHIFENPTVAQLALVVEEESKKIAKEVKESISDKIQSVDSNKEMLNKVNELSDKEVDQWLKLLASSDM